MPVEPDPAVSTEEGPRRRRWARFVTSNPRGRSPLIVELIVVVWLLWIYDAINNLSPVRNATAHANAWSIWHLEQRLHIDIEESLNVWLSHHPVIGSIAANYYDNAHFVVTFGLVGLLWWRFPLLYRPLRNMLVACNLIGFLVFWLYPMAPPRMLTKAGFTDIVAATHAFGSWHAGTLAKHANELAAMPSLHIAWALWCSTALWLISRRPLIRVLAVLYPLVTTLAVLATGNHFVLDVLGGALTAVLAGAAAFGWQRSRDRVAAARSAPPPTAAEEPAVAFAAATAGNRSPAEDGSSVGQCSP